MSENERTYWGDLNQEAGPFFRILHTTSRTQTGFMTVAPGEEAGPPETHEGSDQVFYVVRGEAEFKVWEETGEPEPRRGGAGTVVVVPAGTTHWVKSVGKEDLLFFTVYGPPEY